MADDETREGAAGDDLRDASSPESAEAAPSDLPGDLLDEDLVDPDPVVAEDVDELDVAADAPAAGDDEVVIDDPEDLESATTEAALARSTRPVRKHTTAPVRKDRPTPKRTDQTKKATVARRVTPALFVRQSAGELRKVVWPTREQLGQYFVVVLIFVLFIMTLVFLLDTGLGWLLVKLLG